MPVFIRMSHFRLPPQHNVPIIMVGPGTGLAPFRGFLQERAAAKKQGKDIGQALLFFGCRHPDKDYIYREELESYKDAGVLSELNVAFSRYTDNKVYV